MIMRTILFLLALSLLSACGFSGPRQGVTWYVLDDLAQVQPVAQPVWQGTLLLRETDAPSFYQRGALVYSLAAGTRGYYQYGRLTEWPAPRITQLLRRRLEAIALFPAVAPLASGVEGTWQLNTRLLDFYHDAVAAPGEVKLILEAELIRRADARLFARTRIEVSAGAPSHDARGAAGAANVAVTRALDQLTAWLQQAPKP